MPNILNQKSLMTDSGGKKKNEVVYVKQPSIKPGGDAITPVRPADSPMTTGAVPQSNTPYPTYYSPTAGAQYNYNQAAPTWNWNGTAPTWQWDDSGKPGEWQWDDSGRPGDFSYADAPTYTSQYQDQINQMVYDILNRPAFSYDYNQDPLYQQYAEAYTRNGTQAMNDTLAQMAARTGGLASSYAGTASQQTYNKYMDALNDKIPELYQLAYGMYQDEGNNMRNNLSMVQGLENTDYGRFMDQLGQYNTDRNLAYNQWQTALDQYNNDRNFSYGQYQDLWDRYYNDRNFSYGQYQDQLSQYNNDRDFSYDQYMDAWNQWYKNRDYDYGLWSDNLSRKEAAAKAAYNSQVAAYNAAQTAASKQAAAQANAQATTPSSTKGGTKEPNSGANGTISVIYSGGNVLQLKGPDGRSYGFSTGSASEMAPILNAINSMNISQQEKQALLNEVENQVNKFLKSKKSSSGNSGSGSGSGSGSNSRNNTNSALYNVPLPGADYALEEQLRRQGLIK